MRQFRVRVPNIGAGGGRAVPDMEKILKYPLLFEPEGVFSMSRKGMLSMEEAARGLSRNGVKNYSKGPCVTILE